MRKINLLEQPEKIKRDFNLNWREEKNRSLAREFGEEFFDGDRINGYGGYQYDGRWRKVAEKIRSIYNICDGDSILDVGCAKGFLIYDLQDMVPGINVRGIDISKYALNHAMDGFGKNVPKSEENPNKLEEIARRKVLPSLIGGSADNLPWPNKSFDAVVSINTIHNLPRDKCKKAIREMIRVCRTNKLFIQVDSYRTEIERETIMAWNLTAQTILSEDDWINLFKKNNYNGDYFWTIIERGVQED